MCYLQSVEAIGAELYLKNWKAIVDKRAPDVTVDVTVGWSTSQTRCCLGGYARGGAPIQGPPTGREHGIQGCPRLS
jgi:hypothetical protein